MLLKSIEISGFKSFAKKSELAFTSPISAIVGPNGSGKSNVAEAFRFVLGEQSIKSLRGKKGEDLIFNGALEGARSNRASVRVVFDNSLKFLNVDFPEVTIERVVHRDGVNEYFINGSLVRLKDIIELLSSAHIGASGHHIISQGEADRILNSNIRDRRTMIEDALGLKIYQYKREESEKKLDKTLENIKSIESLRKEIAPHLRFLKKQVEKIEKAAELKTELLSLAKHYIKQEELYITSSKNNLNGLITPLEEKKKLLEIELIEARKILEESKNRDEKSEEVIRLEHSIQEIRAEKDKLLQELGRIQGAIAGEERVVQRQKDLIASQEGKTVPLKSLETIGNHIKDKIKEAEGINDLTALRALFVQIKNMFFEFVDSHRESVDDAVLRESENNLLNFRKEKIIIEDKLQITKNSELELADKYQNIKINIEKEKDSSRDAEKSLFRIMAEQNTLLANLQVEYAKKESLKLIEEDFIREREECALLCGREVLEYRDYPINETEERTIQEERRRSLEKMKIRLEDSGLSGSSEVLKEFNETLERDAFLERELGDLNSSAESLRNLISELGDKLDIEFKEGVQKINNQFQDYFSLMFGGGTAKLSVVKEKKKIRKDTDLLFADDGESDISIADEEQEEGVDIEVSLPRKKIKGLMMLSGGERALTSIALLFAMSQVKPPPFIILDETDAALDEANSKKYGDMIENLSKFSQLILITHNRETMSRAGIIYGVTMGSGGISKILSIQFDEAVAVAK